MNKNKISGDIHTIQYKHKPNSLSDNYDLLQYNDSDEITYTNDDCLYCTYSSFDYGDDYEKHLSPYHKLLLKRSNKRNNN